MDTAAQSRDADRQQVAAPMRRDVRLLGDLLGEVLSESGGRNLLDDVERLRPRSSLTITSTPSSKRSKRSRSGGRSMP